MGVCGVVVAGGAGERLGLGVPKLEAPLCGLPLVYYALRAFENCQSVREVVLVVPEERIPVWTIERLRSLQITKVNAVVKGGASRQESVHNALRAISECEIVSIHDGARPCVTPQLIEKTLYFPPGVSGTILGLRVTDTVKEVSDGKVVSTLEREKLVLVQTPQSFLFQEILKAHEEARRDGFTGTDDASLVERRGGVVIVREGSRTNIKVTYPEDLKEAERILKEMS